MECLRSRSVSFVLASMVGGALLGTTASCTAEKNTGDPQATQSNIPAAAQTCIPHIYSWGKVPPELSFRQAAQSLGFDIRSLQNGQLGTATCEQGIRMTDIETFAPRMIASVPGFGDHCLIIGILPQQIELFDPNKVYKDSYVLCPAGLTSV